jgi:RNA polymerase sigma factor (sigma-70 family)
VLRRARKRGLTGGHGDVFKHDVRTASMDASLGDEEDGWTMHDVFGTNATQEVALVDADARAWLRRAGGVKLRPNERAVLEGRLEGLLLEELGSVLGVTRERVRQIEEDVIGKLQKRVR